MYRQVKSMDEMNEMDDTADGMTAEKDYSHEPVGSQALRRLHDDHKALMEDYHEIHQKLEPDSAVKKHMQKVLENMEKGLSDIEALHAKQYKDLEPIEGAMDQDESMGAEDVEDMEEEAGLDESEYETKGEEDTGEDEEDETPADSEEEELPTPEEAVEGMQTKSLWHKKIKSIRAKIRRKDFSADKEDDDKKEKGWHKDDDEMDTEDKGIDAEDMDKDEEEEAAKALRLVRKLKGVCPGCGKEDCNCQKKCKAVKTKDMNDVQMDRESIEDSGPQGLDDNEMGDVREACMTAKDFGEELNFGDEHRMKSYYHHKTLGRIGAKLGPVAAAAIGGVAGSVMGSNDEKSEVGSPEWQREEQTEPEHQKAYHPHRQLCKDASAFFKNLSSEKNFGEPHREQCKAWHKALNEMTEDVSGTAEVEKGMDEEEIEKMPEPGEMGQKSTIKKKVKSSEKDDLEEENKRLRRRLKELEDSEKEEKDLDEEDVEKSLVRIKKLEDQQAKDMEVLTKRMSSLLNVNGRV